MQAALAFVASGKLDAAITTRRPSPWDSIAGAHLIDRAGGRVTDAGGRPWRHDSGALVASNGHAHGAVLDAARRCLRSE
jgi:myo-inositol-1(or 4)-monophosphatase